MLVLDHLAVACQSLPDGVAWVEEKLGVTMQPGGQHVRYGTHNMLLGLADDLYLEVIAPDPDAAPFDGPRWFDLDRFTGPPRLGNWICRTDRFDPVAGPPRQLSRGDLHWQLTVPDDGSMPYDGAYPTLIQWADNVRHPARGLPDSGCRLTGFEVHHPQAATVADMVVLNDPRVRFVAGPPGFRAIFDTPTGARVLT